MAKHVLVLVTGVLGGLVVSIERVQQAGDTGHNVIILFLFVSVHRIPLGRHLGRPLGRCLSRHLERRYRRRDIRVCVVL